MLDTISKGKQPENPLAVRSPCFPMLYFIDSPQLMSYQDSLRPWVIYQLLPNCQRLTVDRFRHRSTADNYLQILKRLQPQAEYAIVFEVERSPQQ